MLENIRSGIGEWNSMIGNSMANSCRPATRRQDESRASRAEDTLFPFVDIYEGGTAVHRVRLRAVHVQQRAALQDLPDSGQLHEVHQPPLADVRRLRREVPLRQRLLRLLPAGRVGLQLAGGLLRRRRATALANPNRTTTPVTPALQFTDPLGQHPRPRQAVAAARRVVLTPATRRTSGGRAAT